MCRPVRVASSPPAWGSAPPAPGRSPAHSPRPLPGPLRPRVARPSASPSPSEPRQAWTLGFVWPGQPPFYRRVRDAQVRSAPPVPDPVRPDVPAVDVHDHATPATRAPDGRELVVRCVRGPAIHGAPDRRVRRVQDLVIRDVPDRRVHDVRVPAPRLRSAGRASRSVGARRGSAAHGQVWPRRRESRLRPGHSRRGLWPPTGAGADGRAGDAHSFGSPSADLSISSRMLRSRARARAPRRASGRSRTSHPARKTRRSSARWAACRLWPVARHPRVCA